MCIRDRFLTIPPRTQRFRLVLLRVGNVDPDLAGLAGLVYLTGLGSLLLAFVFSDLPLQVLVIEAVSYTHLDVYKRQVHLILGTTLLLVLGVAPAAIGLAAGLAVQSLFFAPTDLPQYGMNVTTLLLPLFATAAVAKRIVKARCV